MHRVVEPQFDAKKANRHYGSGHYQYGDYYQNQEPG